MRGWGAVKAGTTKANEIHDYFVKLEDLLHETLHEECVELKQQVENQVLISQHEQDILREQTLLKQFPSNTKCIYYGKTDNVSKNGEAVIKFGCSNFLADRVKRHKRTYKNFYLMNAFKVDNGQHIENAMKYHPVLEKMRRTIKIDETLYTELLALNAMSYENLDTTIETIIAKVEYSPENYTALLNENEKLKRVVHCLHKKMKDGEIDTTNIESVTNELVTFKQVRKFQKAKDGKYYIDSIAFSSLVGARKEVWDGNAYKTAGGLVKDELMLSNSGKIVSKAKSNHENGNRFLNNYREPTVPL